MTPRLAVACAEAEVVEFIPDLRVRHALLPKFNGLPYQIGVYGLQRLRDQLLPRLLGLRGGNMYGTEEHPKQGW